MIPNQTALIVIDVQNEYFTGKLPITYPENSFSNILDAIQGAHAANIPVILVKHEAASLSSPTFNIQSELCEIHPKVLKSGYDTIITKHFASSFFQTNLKEYLDAHDIHTLVITGYMTQMCCDTTARHASHLGYQVQFLSDATGTLGFSHHNINVSAKALHEAILVTQANFFSQVLSTNDWLQQIAPSK